LREDIKVSFLKITDVVDVSDYLNINLGSEPVWGVQESGFHGQELRGDKPVRWTTGTAKLVVPLDKQRLPKALRVELGASSPEGTKLSILGLNAGINSLLNGNPILGNDLRGDGICDRHNQSIMDLGP
jgi:hypothetical protein